MHSSKVFQRFVSARLLLAAAGFFLVGALAMLSTPSAHAAVGAMDNVPAATLLLPYFEVDLVNENGAQTSIRLSNATATAVLANVTLWTDWGIPTKSFLIYLTGYDTSEIDLRLVFKGHLPRTASAGQDPTDTISPKGTFSQDINYASCSGILPYTTLLPAAEVTALRNAHIGISSATFAGSCGGKNYGDQIARGYVTIDTVNNCTLRNATMAGYFGNGGSGDVTNQNVMVASYTTINRGQNTITTDALVHIEASASNPLTSTPGNPTFYSRFNGTPNNHIDNREPLASVWDVRYLNAGVFTGGTNVKVWRDPVINPTPLACGGAPTPFSMYQIAAFDEQERPAITPASSLPSVPLAGSLTSFPIATQSVASVPLSPFTFGVLRLNFNDIGVAPFGGSRQAHVSAVHTSTGNYAVSVPGVIISPQSAVPGPLSTRIGF